MFTNFSEQATNKLTLFSFKKNLIYSNILCIPGDAFVNRFGS